MSSRRGSKYKPESAQEVEFLANYNPREYTPVAVTVDNVILTIRDGDLCVLLIRRADFPYRGWWALPGGFANPEETLEESARRELREEAKIEAPATHLEQLGTYGDPGRDPRMDGLYTVAYLAMFPHAADPVAGSDAAAARWWPVVDLHDEGIPLAFDHGQILADGLERAASKLEYTPLATAFCHDTFTLGELQRVYEAVWRAPLDKRNFRTKITKAAGFVTPADGKKATGGRLAALYRAGDATLLHPPILRPELRAALRDGDHS